MRTVFIIALFFLAPACGPVNHLPDDAGDAGLPVADAGPTSDVSPDAPSPVDAPPSPDAPAPADTPEIDTHTPEGFAQREAEILCGAWSECAGCDFTVTLAACVADRIESSLTTNDPARFRADQVDAYLERLASASELCQMLTFREYAELFPYRGGGLPPTLPDAFPGDLCDEHEDCTTRNCQPYMEPSGAVVNRCAALPPATVRGPLCR